MIEKICHNCIRWFECNLHQSKYDRNLGKYGNCEDFESNDALDGRIARCCYGCGRNRPSAPSLPFFEYRPDKDYDSYYCGCYGWD